MKMRIPTPVSFLRRAASPLSSRLLLPFFILCAVLGVVLAPASVFAAPTAESAAPSVSSSPVPSSRPEFVNKARENIDAVLATPEFKHTDTIKVPKWQLREWFRELLERWFGDSEASEEPIDWSKGFAMAGEILLWFAIFALIVFLLLRWKRWATFFGWSGKPRQEPPLRQQKTNALPEEIPLPDDIPTAAQRYWAQGRQAEALSILYRGTLALLIERHRVELPQGVTEQEIRQVVGRAIPSLRDYISELTRAWLRLAYAHRPPTEIGGLLAGFQRLSNLRVDAPSPAAANGAAS